MGALGHRGHHTLLHTVPGGLAHEGVELGDVCAQREHIRKIALEQEQPHEILLLLEPQRGGLAPREHRGDLALHLRLHAPHLLEVLLQKVLFRLVDALRGRVLRLRQGVQLVEHLLGGL